MSADAASTVLVQLSDPHLSTEDRSREARFAAAIERACALPLSPAAVLVTGDLAHNAAPEEYATAARLLSAFDMPVHVIPGNKDDRAALRSAFEIAGAPADPVRYVVQAGELRVVMTDSTIPGDVPGQLDVGWIAEQLDAEPGRPTLLAFHHPPYPIGVAGLDAVGLPSSDAGALRVLLERSPQVVRVTCGHVHRATFGTVGGRPACTAPSVSFAFALDIDGGAVSPAEEPPGFLVHTFVHGQLVAHVVPI